jgi:hypothetical protein
MNQIKTAVGENDALASLAQSLTLDDEALLV